MCDCSDTIANGPSPVTVGPNLTLSNLYASNVFTNFINVSSLQINSVSGTAGQVLTATGTGSQIYWSTPSGGSVRTNLSGPSIQVQLTDYYIGCNGTGITVTLPLGSTVPTGKIYVIKDESGLATSSPSYRFTLLVSGSNTIDGGPSAQIITGYSAITVLWTGSLWSII